MQFCKDVGSSPEKLLLRKCNAWSFLRAPIDVGKFPKKLMFSNLRTDNSSKYIQQSGSSPKNKLFERSRLESPILVCGHKKGFGSENKLSFSDNEEIFPRKEGIAPSIEFELKSI